MAQAGFTPISLYFSTTASAVPTSGNLVNGELGINITDGKLYYKDNGGTVRLLASNATSNPVTTIGFGTTGLTPSAATSGAVTVAGTLVAANGGTGQSSYDVGDLLFASGTTALSRLADVATGNALISGGVGVAPSYGKIGLTTHVSGTLPVDNGGTGLTTLTANNVILGNGTSAPTFVAPGATGNVLTSNGTTWVSSAAGGGSSTNFQQFLSSGTWTKPSGATFVLVECLGAGGGGASSSGTNSSANSGGGGGGGAYVYQLIRAADLGSTVTVTVGAGGATTSQTNNQTAGNGGNTSFGSFVLAYGGAGGNNSTSGNNGGVGGGAFSDGGPFQGDPSFGNSQIFGGFGAASNNTAVGQYIRDSGFGGGAGGGTGSFSGLAGGRSYLGGGGGGAGPGNSNTGGGQGGITTFGASGGTGGASFYPTATAGTAGGVGCGGGGGARAGFTTFGFGKSQTVVYGSTSVGAAGGSGRVRVYTW